MSYYNVTIKNNDTQWAGSNSNSITFPISFSTVFRCVLNISTWGDDGAWSNDWFITSLNTTRAYLQYGNGNLTRYLIVTGTK